MLVVVLVLAALTALHLRAAYRLQARRLAVEQVRHAAAVARDHVDAVFASGAQQMRQLAQRHRTSWKEW